MSRGSRTTSLVALTVAGCTAALVMTGPSAWANTRAGAGSYMNTPWCADVVPGDCSGFIIGKGVTVWMNCWTTGPSADGTGKWFDVTVNNNGGKGYGVTGYVPANAVSNQWTSSPSC